MGFVLRIGTATDGTDKIIVAATVHTNHQHVHVIVAEGTGERFFFNLGQGDFLNRFPVILDIRCGAVHMGTGFANPVMYVILTPVAGRK